MMSSYGSYGYKSPRVHVCRAFANNGYCRNGQNCAYSHIHGASNSTLQSFDGEESSSTRKPSSPRRSDHNPSPRAQSSKASSTNQSTSHNRNPRFKPHEGTTICRYFLKNSCTYGDACWYRHEQPEASVSLESESKDTNLKKKDKQKEKVEEEEYTCSICYDVPKCFGLLVECDHVFCSDCIKEWRKTDDLSSPFQTINTTKTCPVCRKNSPYIVPSSTFAKSGPTKDRIISNYRERLSRIPCKYFTESKTCPFADACHYKHANPDGSRCVLGPPRKKKTRSVCPIENFRYLEVSGESSVIDISAISEILGGLSRDHGFRHIFARDWGDNWDDKIDFAENPTWDDDFPFEDHIGSFASDNQDEVVDIQEVDNDNSSGWGNSEWEAHSSEWWSGWD